jgi:hypothetical protein
MIPFPRGSKSNDVFACGKHNASERDHLHLFDHPPDHHESALPDLAIRCDVVRTDIVKFIDLLATYQLGNFYRARALKGNCFQLLVCNLDVLPLSDLVCFHDLLGRYLLARALTTL